MSTSTAQSIIAEFQKVFDDLSSTQTALQSVSLRAARYISSCGQTAIDELETASSDKLSKRILPLLAKFTCSTYSLEFSDAGTARLIAMRDTASEKKCTTWSALPVFHCAELEKGFKPIFRIPQKQWTWTDCRNEFCTILEKRGLANYAAKLRALDIDSI